MSNLSSREAFLIGGLEMKVHECIEEFCAEHGWLPEIAIEMKVLIKQHTPVDTITMTFTVAKDEE